MSEQALVRSGKVRTTRYEIDASYPQFDGANADFSAVNKAFASAAEKGANDAVPGTTSAVTGINQIWTYLQSFQLFRPAPTQPFGRDDLLFFTGGAHGSSGVTATLVDLRTGRSVPPAGVFVAGSDWKRTITDITRADLKRQFVRTAGLCRIARACRLSTSSWTIPRATSSRPMRSRSSSIKYDVGPYAVGRYTVDIPYSRLATLIRTDGPFGR